MILTENTLPSSFHTVASSFCITSQALPDKRRSIHGDEQVFSEEKKTRHGGELDFSEEKQRGNKTNGRFSIRLERAEARREGKLPVADTNGNKQSRTASNRRKPCG